MVRRLLANCGHPVVALHRVRYGDVHLGELEEGDAMAVEGAELEAVLRLSARHSMLKGAVLLRPSLATISSFG